MHCPHHDRCPLQSSPQRKVLWHLHLSPTVFGRFAGVEPRLMLPVPSALSTVLEAPIRRREQLSDDNSGPDSPPLATLKQEALTKRACNGLSGK